MCFSEGFSGHDIKVPWRSWIVKASSCSFALVNTAAIVYVDKLEVDHPFVLIEYSVDTESLH